MANNMLYVFMCIRIRLQEHTPEELLLNNYIYWIIKF